MLSLDLLTQDADPFFEERSAANQLSEFSTELVSRLLDNTVLEGAITIHREFMRRKVSDEVMRSVVVSHPRLVFSHPSTSEELRDELLMNDELRSRLFASPFFGSKEYCAACVLDSSSGRQVTQN